MNLPEHSLQIKSILEPILTKFEQTVCGYGELSVKTGGYSEFMVAVRGDSVEIQMKIPRTKGEMTDVRMRTTARNPPPILPERA